MKKIARKIAKSFKPNIRFDDLLRKSNIYLYAGDVPQTELYSKFVGLSLKQNDDQHIKHDVTKHLPLNANSVDVYQSEDVFEHIEPEKLVAVINEIYRVLKFGGVFRLALPDYRCDILQNRTLKKPDGEILFDPGGGGDFVNGKVVGGGHIWFPTYEKVKAILDETSFSNVDFLHYYNEKGEGVTKTIDYTIGHVMRTPDHDSRVREPYRPMSIVVDCKK